MSNASLVEKVLAASRRAVFAHSLADTEGDAQTFRAAAMKESESALSDTREEYRRLSRVKAREWAPIMAMEPGSDERRAAESEFNARWREYGDRWRAGQFEAVVGARCAILTDLLSERWRASGEPADLVAARARMRKAAEGVADAEDALRDLGRRLSVLEKARVLQVQDHKELQAARKRLSDAQAAFDAARNETLTIGGPSAA